MTAEPLAAVTRERRLANLRATLARTGGPPLGPDQPPARAPFAGRRSAVLAARLAAALGADVADTPAGTLVRRVVPPVPIPLDRDRLARLPGPPAAGRAARLPGHRDDGPRDGGRDARVPRRARPLGRRRVPPDAAPAPGPRGRGRAARRDRGLDHARHVARDLQRPGVRLAADRGPIPARRTRGAVPRRPPGPAARSCGACSATGWRTRGCAPSRGSCSGISRIGDVEGWEIPGIYLDVLRGGPVEPLAGVVVHNEKDVRSLGLLLAYVERRYAERSTRHAAPRGDLAGLARAYGRELRHAEALDCLDDALAAAAPVRDPFGRSPVRAGPDPGAGRGPARRLVDAPEPPALRRHRAAVRMGRGAGERARRTPRPGTGRGGVGGGGPLDG